VQAFFGFGGGGKVDDAKSYICVDCGWIYDAGKFSEAPGSFKCPVCQSPKRRFKPYAGKVSGRPKNDSRSMDARYKAKEW